MSTWVYVTECRGHLLELCASVVPDKRVDFAPGVVASRPASYAEMGEFWTAVIRAYDQQADAVLANFLRNREIAIRYLGMTPSKRARVKVADADRVDLSAASLWYGRKAAMWLAKAEANGSLRGGRGYREATEEAAWAAVSKVPRKESLKFFPLQDYELDLSSRMRERWCWDLDDADPNLVAWSS